MEQLAVMTEERGSAGLVESCQRGDREAFRLLFEGYKDKVYSVALYFFGGDEALASDVTQQVFLKLFTRIGQFRHQSEFSTWLYRLTTNACIDEQRKRKRFEPAGDAESALLPRARGSAEEKVARHEVRDELQSAIAALKPKLRIAILLKYFEELSYAEIADALGCSQGTVASRINRGHKVLARRLGHLRGSMFGGE
ncbi:MAG: sigma-70 family RNA polymerase sigma factor [Acidobacteria bacterium]|nr:sigma-70 family RNA polymerase sigma factor [Acidobacteriota bacterium]MCA1643261.1 sigma-70 family RNA polymerase sigma factor [Acidobacteriota bacterium]